MNYKELRNRLRGITPRLSLEYIKKYEKECSISLPYPVIELLQEVSGGEFDDRALFSSGDLELVIRGFCSISVNHLYDISDCIEIDDEPRPTWIPFAYTYSGDYIVYDDAVFFWNHESGILKEICSNIAEFINNLSFSSQISDFDHLCGYASLDEMMTSHFTDKYDKFMENAAKCGNLLLVKQCVEKQMPVGKSLRFAAMNGNWEILDYLLETGYDLNAKDDSCKTVLDWLEWKPSYFNEVRLRGGRLSSELLDS